VACARLGRPLPRAHRGGCAARAPALSFRARSLQDIGSELWRFQPGRAPLQGWTRGTTGSHRRQLLDFSGRPAEAEAADRLGNHTLLLLLLQRGLLPPQRQRPARAAGSAHRARRRQGGHHVATRSRATIAVPSTGDLRVASVLPVLASGSGPRRLPAAVGRLRSPRH